MYGSPARIWAQTLAVVAIYVASIFAIDRFLLRDWMSARALTLAVAFATVQITAIAIMLIVLLTKRGLAQRRTRRSREIAAAAHAAVAEHAAGMDRLRVLRELRQRSRRDVSAAVASFVAATRGSMHERVRTLARDLGMSEREVIEEGTIERAAAGSLFERALIADEMQPRAEEIVKLEIPEALISRDEKKAVAALDLLLSWRRVFRVRGVDYALLHESEDVRSRAYRAIPYVEPSHAAQLANGLRDRSPRVREAAADTAGRLRLFLPELEEALRDPHVALPAAFALARTEEGRAVLQRSESRVAFEALEKAMMGRLDV